MIILLNGQNGTVVIEEQSHINTVPKCLYQNGRKRKTFHNNHRMEWINLRLKNSLGQLLFSSSRHMIMMTKPMNKEESAARYPKI